MSTSDFHFLLRRGWVQMVSLALVGAAGNAIASVPLLNEDFEGLPLKNADSPTELAAPGVWTEVPPAGWSRDNLFTPVGNPVEFQGWTFVDKSWWVSTAGDQQRSAFTTASGTVAVADPDEYDDGTDIDGQLFNARLQTPPMSLAGIAANSVIFSFESSWRNEVTQDGYFDVSFDGGITFVNVLWYDSEVLPEGLLVNGPLSFPLANPSGGSLIGRWSLLDGSNDFWWAIDNVQVTGEPLAAAVVPETSTWMGGGLMLTAAVGLAWRRRRQASEAMGPDLDY